jgi:RYK receptor-like tyrosine kinase
LKQLPYQIKLTTADPTVLPLPVLNISSIGEISTQVQTFDIELKCSGIRAAEVEVTIAMEITLNPTTNNVTELVFRRNKICLER